MLLQPVLGGLADRDRPQLLLVIGDLGSGVGMGAHLALLPLKSSSLRIELKFPSIELDKESVDVLESLLIELLDILGMLELLLPPLEQDIVIYHWNRGVLTLDLLVVLPHFLLPRCLENRDFFVYSIVCASVGLFVFVSGDVTALPDQNKRNT